MTTPDTPPSLPTLLDNVEEWLRYEVQMGRTVTSVPGDVMAQLASLENITMNTSTPSESDSEESTAPASQADRGPAMDAIIRTVAGCTGCPLHSTRTNTVPGEGSLSPEVMFIGEGPGADEDAQGRPFVGRAGKLLTKMIEAMGFEREDVYIANIVKCRPPENRVPTPEEMTACMPYLKEQIAIVQPRVIVALGATAVKGLLDTKTGITKLRGNWHRFEGFDLMPTFHPAYLLRNPPAKKEAWDDLKEVLSRLGRTPPPVKK